MAITAAAATSDQKSTHLAGALTVLGDTVAAATTVYKNTLVNRTTSTGLCKPGADASGETFAGVAYGQFAHVVATTDSTTPQITLAKNGVWVMKLNATTGAQSLVGTAVFVADDNSVDVAGQTANDVPCGKIACWLGGQYVGVDITGYAY